MHPLISLVLLFLQSLHSLFIWLVPFLITEWNVMLWVLIMEFQAAISATVYVTGDEAAYFFIWELVLWILLPLCMILMGNYPILGSWLAHILAFLLIMLPGNVIRSYLYSFLFITPLRALIFPVRHVFMVRWTGICACSSTIFICLLTF